MTTHTDTADRTAAAQRITAHFDDFAPDYHATAFDGAGMTHLSTIDLDNVRRAADLVDGPTRRACDVGVGTGRISSELIRLGFGLIGVDASTGMLAEARSTLPAADLRVGSLADRLPVDDDDVDLVTCLRVVKYLPDWPAAIVELARVARPGGIVCFDLANARSAARFGYPEGMVWPVTHDDARLAVTAAGLDLIEMRPGVHLPDPLWRTAASATTARVVRSGEAALGVVLGRHGARSWTFITRKRAMP